MSLGTRPAIARRSSGGGGDDTERQKFTPFRIYERARERATSCEECGKSHILFGRSNARERWRNNWVGRVGKVQEPPSVGAAESPGQKIRKYQQICRFRAANCTKMRLATALRPDPLGELSRSPHPSRYKGEGSGKKGWDRGRKWMEGKDVKG